MNPIEVHPTGNAASGQHSDIALTAVFTAMANLVNSERATIWQRQTSMTLANSIVLGFFVRGEHPVLIFTPVVGCILGLCLCLAWLVMSARGWHFYAIYVSQAASFSWPGSGVVNPFLAETTYRSKCDWIHVAANCVIGLFAVTYAVILVGLLR
jgi:hypothetical protein